jgi:hypothetical protein
MSLETYSAEARARLLAAEERYGNAFVNACAFRGKAAGHSDRSQPVIPKFDTPGGGDGGEDMAMRPGALDDEAAGADQLLAAESGAQGLDLLKRKIGEIDEGAVLDVAAVAVGFAKEIERSAIAVGDGDNVYEQSDHGRVVVCQVDFGGSLDYFFASIGDLSMGCRRTW